MFCSIDPDFLRENELRLNGLKSLADLNKIEDAELKQLILENSVFCTNAEPAEARTLLPCLDEPSFKAIF